MERRTQAHFGRENPIWRFGLAENPAGRQSRVEREGKARERINRLRGWMKSQPSVTGKKCVLQREAGGAARLAMAAFL